MNDISTKKKIIMGGALGILIVIALFIKMGGGAAAKLAEQMLQHQNLAAGSLSYGKIGAGFAGDVEIRNIVWKAPNGDVKAEIPLTTISVNFFETLRKGGGIGSVTNIVLNKPHFYGVYEEGQGLDLLNLVKWAGQTNKQSLWAQSEKDVKPTEFRGLIEIKDGVLQLVSNGKRVELTKLNSQVAFKQYPLLRGGATGSKESCDLVLNMTWETGKANVTGEAKNMPVADLLATYPDLKNIIVKGGVVPTVTIHASKDAGGWHMDLSGKPKNISGEIFGLSFTEGTGSFRANRDEAELEQLQLKINEMPLTVTGKIRSGRGTPLPPGYDLSFRATNFKTQALSSGLFLKDGAVNLEGRLTGTSLEPTLSGSFAADTLVLAPLQLSAVRGGFLWDFGKLRLQNAAAQCAGTTVNVEGSLDLKTREYQFTLGGSGLDAAQLTDNKVTGLLALALEMKGKNQQDSAFGTGSFALQNGRYYYMDAGKEKNEEIRFLQGDIVVENSNFATRGAEMKLGRNKYGVSVLLTEAGKVEIKVGEKRSWSLF